MGLSGIRPGSRKKEQSKSSQRKSEKRISFYTKVKEATASLAPKKAIDKKRKLRSRQKKLKAFDLSALQEFLPDLDIPEQSSNETYWSTRRLVNCKSRRKLVLRETMQFAAVLNNSSFQADPFEAIHRHISNTQHRKVESKSKGSGKSKSRRMKKKAKKAQSSTSQAMDILSTQPPEVESENKGPEVENENKGPGISKRRKRKAKKAESSISQAMDILSTQPPELESENKGLGKSKRKRKRKAKKAQSSTSQAMYILSTQPPEVDSGNKGPEAESEDKVSGKSKKKAKRKTKKGHSSTSQAMDI